MEQKEYVRLAADVIDEIYSLTVCYNQIIKRVDLFRRQRKYDYK
jgi:hypothetical protein